MSHLQCSLMDHEHRVKNNIRESASKQESSKREWLQLKGAELLLRQPASPDGKQNPPADCRRRHTRRMVAPSACSSVVWRVRGGCCGTHAADAAAACRSAVTACLEQQCPRGCTAAPQITLLTRAAGKPARIAPPTRRPASAAAAAQLSTEHGTSVLPSR